MIAYVIQGIFRNRFAKLFSLEPAKDEFKVRVPAKESDSKDKTAERQKKIEKHVEKLQKRLVQIHREIEKLETAEVDWDDEENESPYIKEDRYKKKAVQIYKAIRKLQNESLSNARILEEKLKVKDDEIKKEWIIMTNITGPRWACLFLQFYFKSPFEFLFEAKHE